MASDLENQATQIKPIEEIAQNLGLEADDFDLHGKTKAKIALAVLTKFAARPTGKYVVVTSITPMPLGEGKTTTAIGLAMALNRLGQRAAVTLRQPSLGPIFGIKGGGTGGGRAQVLPTAEINLHLTGDAHAVTLAHNLLAAFVDNMLYHGNPLELDPWSITWARASDLNDRALRKILTGLGGRENGIPRESAFLSTVASEVMAILALATSRQDLRARLGRIIVGATRAGKMITAQDLECAGAMAALLNDALRPNLVQTSEHTPALIHTDPSAPIAPANNSILADRIALKLCDMVITESGFGSDLGLEKFFNLKTRASGLTPHAIVLVTTIRALKMHGGVGRVGGGKPLPPELLQENFAALERGCANLIQHIENGNAYHVPVIVAINRYAEDTEREIAIVEQIARNAGAESAVVSDAYARGGAGAIALAEAVTRACANPPAFKFLYALELPIKAKIERIAERMYGADGVEYTARAEEKIKRLTDLGFAKLPITIAKTHLSLTHDPQIKGRPRKFRLPIVDVNVAAGAGWLSAHCDDPQRGAMPALPRVPAGARVDVDADGKIIGLG